MYTLLKKAVLRHYFIFTSFFGKLFLVVKRNFNTCFHYFLNKFVIKVHWISITFFSFCVFMFSYVLVHILLYIYILNFVLYGSFHLVLPPLTWYAWFFFKFDVLFFYWQAARALEMNKESLLILFRFRYKFQGSFFSPQAAISRLFTKRSKFVRGARLSTTNLQHTTSPKTED